MLGDYRETVFKDYSFHCTYIHVIKNKQARVLFQLRKLLVEELYRKVFSTHINRVMVEDIWKSRWNWHSVVKESNLMWRDNSPRSRSPRPHKCVRILWNWWVSSAWFGWYGWLGVTVLAFPDQKYSSFWGKGEKFDLRNSREQKSCRSKLAANTKALLK